MQKLKNEIYMPYVLATQLWQIPDSIGFLPLSHWLTDFGLSSCDSGNIYLYCICMFVYDYGENQKFLGPLDRYCELDMKGE